MKKKMSSPASVVRIFWAAGLGTLPLRLAETSAAAVSWAHQNWSNDSSLLEYGRLVCTCHELRPVESRAQLTALRYSSTSWR